MKVFLIGYMGCGKSTVGRKLAEKLKLDYIDFDKHIEKERRKTISEIFDDEGEEKFRILEHEYLKKLFKKENVVIALGGGTPCFHDNIQLINKNGISVYLKMSSDTLLTRLSKEKNKRPLICDLNDVDLKNFIETHLKKRKAFYQKANHIIQSDHHTADNLAEKIIKLIRRGN